MMHFIFWSIGMIVIAATLISLRREHIRPEYSVSWLALGGVVFLLALFPGAVEKAARNLQIDGGDCLIIVAGTLVSALVFDISHVVSRIRDENVVLAQRVAILEFRIQLENGSRSHEKDHTPGEHQAD